MTHHRLLPTVSGLIALAAVLAGVWALDSSERNSALSMQRSHVFMQGGSIRGRLEEALNARLHLAEELANYVIIRNEISETSFNSYARSLQEHHQGIRSIQLAPDAVVTLVYPFEGNESAKGHDLRADPASREAVEQAIAERKFLVTGPVQLDQGGVGIVGRLPIFLPDPNGEPGRDRFWGFSIIVIDLETLLKDGGVIEKSGDLRVVLRGRNGLGAEGEVFFGDHTVLDADPITFDVALPNGSWQLAAMPKGGWNDTWHGREALFLGGCALAFFAGILIFLLYSQIIERKRASDALRASEEWFRTIVDNSPTKIHIKDLEGRYLLVNKKAEKLFGVTDQEARGKTTHEIFPEMRAADFASHDRAVIESGQTITEEEEWSRDDGVHTFLTVKFPIRDGTGRITAVGAIGTEITERKNTELALRESQLRLNSIMNSVADAVFTYDGDGLIQTFNSAAERIFGYSMFEVLNKNIRTLMPEVNADDHDDGPLNTWHKDATTFAGIRSESVGRRKDGTNFPLEASFNRMDLPGQTMIVGICRDITERKNADEKRAELVRELAQALKLESLGTLAGGIAHEINTPVQYVGDNIRFLQTSFADLGTVLEKYKTLLGTATAEEVLPDAVAKVEAAVEAADLDYLAEEIPPALTQSLEGIEQISEIVRAIKEFSRPDMKEKCAIDIHRAITSTITVTRNQWKYVAEMETDFDTSLPLVPCLPGEINQVILNLIVNASHAIEEVGSESPGRITISTRRVDDWAEIRIADTGTGISAEIRDKIFDPFFTTKEVGKGTGQGLAISHNIITKKHGGRISVDSEAGEGTMFIIRLPLSDNARSDEAA